MQGILNLSCPLLPYGRRCGTLSSLFWNGSRRQHRAQTHMSQSLPLGTPRSNAVTVRLVSALLPHLREGILTSDY